MMKLMKTKAWMCLAFILCLSLVPFANADWAMFHSNAAHDGIGQGASVASPKLLWNFTTGDAVNSSPAVVHGIVYFGSYDGFVYALDAVNGRQIWNYSDSNSGSDASPAVANGVVYIGDECNNFYALNAEDGKNRWNFSALAVVGSPTVDNGRVYIGQREDFGEGGFFALNGSNGVQLWNFSIGPGTYGDPITAAAARGVVYFGICNDYMGSQGGNIWALDSTTGRQVWMDSIEDAAFMTTPTVVNGVVYIGINGHEVGSFGLYALDASNGKELWKYMVPTGLENYVTTTPAAANGVVYFGSRDGEVYALRAASGSLIWEVTAGEWLFSSPAVVDQTVYIGSGDGNLYALNCADGSTLWNYTIGGTYSSPAVSDGVIYIGAGNQLYALTDASASTPTSIFAPTPTQTTSAIQAVKEDHTNVTLAIKGNITDSQISQAAIAFDQSTNNTVVSFEVTGESGTTGFCNITIPKSAVPYGTIPTIYIDKQKASSQGYGQDANNYYVWFTTHFSTHQISIVFSNPASQNENIGLLQIAILGVMAAVAGATIVGAAVFLRKNRG